jgi:hypothetical protein
MYIKVIELRKQCDKMWVFLLPVISNMHLIQ